MNTRKEGSRNILSAARKAQGLPPLFAGGVCGNSKQKSEKTIPEKPPSQSESAPARPSKPEPPGKSEPLSLRTAVKIKPAAIQPIVPQTRTRPNFFSASGR